LQGKGAKSDDVVITPVGEALAAHQAADGTVEREPGSLFLTARQKGPVTKLSPSAAAA
jgi:hypothetical protein